jgi:hypothetical protein
MPTARSGELDIENLLEELESKKRWLDVVIAALEVECEAPRSLLAEAVKSATQDGQVPLVDLSSESRSLLLHLASQVRQGARGVREERRATESKVA